MQGEVILPLIGGILIGLSATIMLLALGRITGISGIYSGLFVRSNNFLWQAFFVIGLVGGGVLMNQLSPHKWFEDSNASTALLAVGGLLVGFGTRLGSGCTSGHGICGLSRMSPRSFVSVLTFMGFGVLTVFLMKFF